MLKQSLILVFFALISHLSAMGGAPSTPLMGENFPAPPAFIAEEKKIEARNLQVSQIGDDHVALKWEADNQILGFRVYYKSSTDFVAYAELSGEQENATVTNLDASTTYTFRLVALDQFFGESEGVEVVAKTLQKVAQAIISSSPSVSATQSSSSGSSAIGTKELTLGETAQIAAQIDPTNTSNVTADYTQNDTELEVTMTSVDSRGTMLTVAKIQNAFSPQTTKKEDGSLEITLAYEEQTIIFSTDEDGNTFIEVQNNTATHLLPIYRLGSQIELEMVDGEAILDATTKLENNKITF